MLPSYIKLAQIASDLGQATMFYSMNLSTMASFKIVYMDGSPVRHKQVIIIAAGEWGYGITNNNGFVRIPVSGDKGKIIIGGQTVYYGDLGVDALRIGS